MKHLLLILLTFLLINCSTKNNSQKTILDSREKYILDSLKKVLNTSDSIRILFNNDKDTVIRTTVLIDYNLKSEYHKSLEKELSYINYDSSYYYQLYNKQLENGVKKSIQNFSIPESYRTIWIPVYSMKNSFYVLSQGDYQVRYEINDSTFITGGQTGAEPYIIESFKASNNGFEIYSESIGSITFTEIDKEKSVFKLKKGNECVYLVPLKRLYDFPIIYVRSWGTDSYESYIELDNIECK